MLSSVHAEQEEGVIEKVKALLSRLTWKHALIVSIPLAIYLFPRPIFRLFLPLASKINRNHPPVSCNHLIREIVLTANDAVTLDNISHINVLKGAAPNVSTYSQDEVAVIELFAEDQGANPYSSQMAVLKQPRESEIRLYAEALWTNLRMTRLERPQLKAVLIKSSEEVLRLFILKFYKLDKASSHKIGFLGHNKLSILRLDERVGTYEHLTCEFGPIRP